MNRSQIQAILQQKNIQGLSDETSLIETHISWIILTEEYVYKIKKPFQFSFLDFSTLDKRRFYCEQEVLLNQRLAKDIYLRVVPIRQSKEGVFIDADEGQIIDYAVKMKRLDNKHQMDVLLEEEKVTKEHIVQIADQLATFHAFTDVVESEPLIAEMQVDFADVANVQQFLNDFLGETAVHKTEEAIEFSRIFLQLHEQRIKERHALGFFIDGHGDLHSGNIFLLEEPVIFDCIEFNEHFRHLDVLDELAFFCMDLDFYGQEELESHFLRHYNEKYPVFFNDEDFRLFQYFKLYRANVRLKVNSLKAMQATNHQVREKRSGLVEDYYNLFKRYLRLCKEQLLSISPVLA